MQRTRCDEYLLVLRADAQVLQIVLRKRTAGSGPRKPRHRSRVAAALDHLRFEVPHDMAGLIGDYFDEGCELQGLVLAHVRMLAQNVPPRVHDDKPGVCVSAHGGGGREAGRLAQGEPATNPSTPEAVLIRSSVSSMSLCGPRRE